MLVFVLLTLKLVLGCTITFVLNTSLGIHFLSSYFTYLLGNHINYQRYFILDISCDMILVSSFDQRLPQSITSQRLSEWNRLHEQNTLDPTCVRLGKSAKSKV